MAQPSLVNLLYDDSDCVNICKILRRNRNVNTVIHNNFAGYHIQLPNKTTLGKMYCLTSNLSWHDVNLKTSKSYVDCKPTDSNESRTFFVCFLRCGWAWVHLLRRPRIGLLYQPQTIDDEWSSRWNENWWGKPKYSEKTYPSATLSTTNPTWLDPGSKPGRCNGKLATNRLSYGAA
jgi:hypothetical protein